MYKKILSKILISTLTLGILSNSLAFANTKDNIINKYNLDENSKENLNEKDIDEENKIIDLSNKFLKILDDSIDPASLTEIEYDELQDYYSIKYEPSNGSFVYITIDPKTQLLQGFNKYVYSSETCDEHMDYKSAKKLAYETSLKFYGDFSKKLQLEEEIIDSSMHLDSYSFSFRRVENNIPFYDQYVKIYIDTHSGKINDILVNFIPNITIPKPDNLKTLESIDTKFRENAKIDLGYSSFDDKTLSLTYSLNHLSTNDINAVTGDFIHSSYLLDSKEVKPSEQQRKNILTEAEKNTTTSELTEAEILSIGQELAKDIFNEDIEIGEPSPLHDGWVFSFMYGDEYLHIQLDKFGELNYITYNENENLNKKSDNVISYEKAYESGINFLLKYMPSKLKEMNLDATMYLRTPSNEEHANVYDFQFNRTINGIPYPGEYICLGINSETGKVLDVTCSLSDFTSIESSENIIPMEEAKKLFLDSYKTTLKYSSGFDKNSSKAELIYTFEPKDFSKPFNYISATTGKLLDYKGIDILAEEKFYKDIENSPYKKEILDLYDIGALNPEEFQCNKEITLLDFIKTIHLSYGSDVYEPMDIEINSDITKDHVNYDSIYFAIGEGIITDTEKEIKFLEPITKEELSKYVVNYLNYDQVTKLNDYVTLPFSDKKDISKENFANVAFVSSLGIMEGSNGKWNPKEKVTMEYMCKVISKMFEIHDSFNNY